jgi:hypothetical protein
MSSEWGHDSRLANQALPCTCVHPSSLLCMSPHLVTAFELASCPADCLHQWQLRPSVELWVVHVPRASSSQSHAGFVAIQLQLQTSTAR